eukprot:TRINITY_DN27245_c0_g2_i1.p1 TRINITY_DN27245_c0_g2~~TRINITY_DN27245_c0_g2_i1.p1  ORF type:complete len:572 (-),score=71.96 TRINITY_DN27245_c0_g2_i1:98-1735(-)
MSSQPRAGPRASSPPRRSPVRAARGAAAAVPAGPLLAARAGGRDGPRDASPARRLPSPSGDATREAPSDSQAQSLTFAELLAGAIGQAKARAYSGSRLVEQRESSPLSCPDTPTSPKSPGSPRAWAAPMAAVAPTVCVGTPEYERLLSFLTESQAHIKMLETKNRALQKEQDRSQAALKVLEKEKAMLKEKHERSQRALEALRERSESKQRGPSTGDVTELQQKLDTVERNLDALHNEARRKTIELDDLPLSTTDSTRASFGHKAHSEILPAPMLGGGSPLVAEAVRARDACLRRPESPVSCRSRAQTGSSSRLGHCRSLSLLSRDAPGTPALPHGRLPRPGSPVPAMPSDHQGRLLSPSARSRLLFAETTANSGCGPTLSPASTTSTCTAAPVEWQGGVSPATSSAIGSFPSSAGSPWQGMRSTMNGAPGYMPVLRSSASFVASPSSSPTSTYRWLAPARSCSPVAVRCVSPVRYGSPLHPRAAMVGGTMPSFAWPSAAVPHGSTAPSALQAQMHQDIRSKQSAHEHCDEDGVGTDKEGNCILS